MNIFAAVTVLVLQCLFIQIKTYLFLFDNDLREMYVSMHKLVYRFTPHLLIFRRLLHTAPPHTMLHICTCGGAEFHAEEHSSVYDSHQVFTRRQLRVNETCRKYGVEASYGTDAAYPIYRLRWLNKKKMVMCFVSKVNIESLLIISEYS